MIRRTLLTAAVMLFAGALAPGLPAGAGMDPATFINNLGHQLQLVTSNTSRVQRLAGFRELFHDNFDVPGLGRFVLGRFWRILTPSEQQEFLGLFENYVVCTYSDRLSEYAGSGNVLRVTGSRLDPDGAIVSSEIIRGSEAVRRFSRSWSIGAWLHTTAGTKSATSSSMASAWQ
jgi:phospholipid transport system substrate-binding protein